MASYAWEPLDNENKRPYGLFLEYRNMPPRERNLDAIARGAGLAEGTLRGYASRYNWTARAKAWDLHQANEVARGKQPQLAVKRARVQDHAMTVMCKALDIANDIFDDVATRPTDASREEISLIKCVITTFGRAGLPDDLTEPEDALVYTDTKRADRIEEIASAILVRNAARSN